MAVSSCELEQSVLTPPHHLFISWDVFLACPRRATGMIADLWLERGTVGAHVEDGLVLHDWGTIRLIPAGNILVKVSDGGLDRVSLYKMEEAKHEF